MKKNPALLSIFFLAAITVMTMKLAIRVYRTVGTAKEAVTLCGNKTWPIPIDKVESTIQLPTMSPTAMECCLVLRALISTANSGREVPTATIKKLIIYSCTFNTVEITITDWTIRNELMVTPPKPIAAISK